jgi:hypothetical protein
VNSPLLGQKTCARLVLFCRGKKIRRVTPSIGRAANCVVRAGSGKVAVGDQNPFLKKLFWTVFEFLLLLAPENGETLRSRRQYWNFGMFQELNV